MIFPEDKADAREAGEIVARIVPMLAGATPPVVGAVLGELAARFVASHAPEWRGSAKDMLTELVNRLIPLVVEEMIKSGKVSAEEWRGPTIQ
jgi:hypothetical protein